MLYRGRARNADTRQIDGVALTWPFDRAWCRSKGAALGRDIRRPTCCAVAAGASPPDKQRRTPGSRVHDWVTTSPRSARSVVGRAQQLSDQNDQLTRVNVPTRMAAVNLAFFVEPY
jgi:hypothetical protein